MARSPKEAIEVAQSFQATSENTNCFEKPKEVSVITSDRSRKSECRFCGTHHPPKQCLAYGHTCEICGKKNHLPVVCFKAKNQSRSMSRRSKSPRRSKSRNKKTEKSNNDSKTKKVEVVDYFDCGQWS